MSSSYDRDNRAPERGSDHTVVVTDRGRGGGSGWLIAGILIVVVVVAGIFLFGGNLFGSGGGVAGGGGGDTNVSIETPDINVGTPAPAGGDSAAPAAPVN